MADNKVYGLIPAAGLSSRMGRPKLSLPLGETKVLQCVIAALLEGGIDQVVVVLGPEYPIAPWVTNLGAALCVLPRQTPDMSASVRSGLEWLVLRHGPCEEDAWLLVPGDHPTVQPGIIGALLAARIEHPQCSIIVPTHEGRRGHPTLSAWKHAQNILRSRWDQGLNVYFRQYAAETYELPWPTPEILWDLDTPEDYQRLLQWYKANQEK